MKKNTILTLLMLLAVVAAVGTVFCRHILPRWQVSDLYRRYEHVDGIAASYIHNYHVNDTLTLDVTLLEATTDSSWQALCSNFAISNVVEEIEKVAPDAVFCRQVNRRDYTQTIAGDSPDAELLTISCATKTLAIFHTCNKNDIRAVFCYTWLKQ